jgi:hypothetical protein
MIANFQNNFLNDFQKDRENAAFEAEKSLCQQRVL